MNIEEYKQSLKELIDSTNNEVLLKHWKRQLEFDVKRQDEVELSEEEWNLVKEGISAYENGETILLQDFIKKKS